MTRKYSPADEDLLREALNPATRVDSDGTYFEHAEPIHAAGATVKVQTTHEADGSSERRIIVELSDEPLTAAEARQLASAILEAADQIDGRETSVHSTKSAGSTR